MEALGLYMTAKITSDLTNIFARYINGDTEVFGLNDSFAQIQVTVNFIVDKIIEKGYNMSQLELRTIDNIGDAIEVFNANVTSINEYLISISELIGTDYLISKEILSTMKIDVLNNDSSTSIRVNADDINVSMANGQEIVIKEGIIVSMLGSETIISTHA